MTTIITADRALQRLDRAREAQALQQGIGMCHAVAERMAAEAIESFLTKAETSGVTTSAINVSVRSQDLADAVKEAGFERPHQAGASIKGALDQLALELQSQGYTAHVQRHTFTRCNERNKTTGSFTLQVKAEPARSC